MTERVQGRIDLVPIHQHLLIYLDSEAIYTLKNMKTAVLGDRNRTVNETRSYGKVR